MDESYVCKKCSHHVLDDGCNYRWHPEDGVIECEHCEDGKDDAHGK